MAPGWESKVKAAAQRPLRNVANDIADDTRGNIRGSGNVVTGAYLRSVKVRPTYNGWRVWVGTDHWHFIEYGTKPHLIRARSGGVLASNTRVFGSVVRHPGTRAYANVRRAAHKKRSLRG